MSTENVENEPIVRSNVIYVRIINPDVQFIPVSRNVAQLCNTEIIFALQY